MITPIVMDDMVPPTWDGLATPLSAVNTTADQNTRCRFLVGQDILNYFTGQRIEGDLFKRDLVLKQSQQELIDFLSTRAGMTISVCDVIIPAPDSGSSYITIGRINIPSSIGLTGGWVVQGVIDTVLFQGAGNLSNVSLSVVPIDSTGTPNGAPIFSITGASPTSAQWGAATTADRGPVIVANTEYAVILASTAVSDVSCSAKLIWNNKSV